MMNVDAIANLLLDWYAANARDLPWRRTRDPYAIWVSEVMLQQTQVATVIPYWERWMGRLPDVKSLAEASEQVILKLWEGLGYYRRARNLRLAARQIMQRSGGVFPSDLGGMLELPGVGRYTAGAVCSVAFDEPEPIVDGNVVRVLSRIEAVAGDPAEPSVNRQMWGWARQLVEAASVTGRAKACSHLNQALMELGATVCTPREPECTRCPLALECRAYRAGNPAGYPKARSTPRVTPRHFVVIVAEHEDLLCIRRRPDNAVNGGLWEFPNIEVNSPEADPSAIVRRLFGVRRVKPEPWCRVRHSITRYRITQHVHRVAFLGVRPATRAAGEWRTLEELRSLAFSAAHRRIVDRLGEANESAD